METITIIAYVLLLRNLDITIATVTIAIVLLLWNLDITIATVIHIWIVFTIAIEFLLWNHNIINIMWQFNAFRGGLVFEEEILVLLIADFTELSELFSEFHFNCLTLCQEQSCTSILYKFHPFSLDF